ncbi:hypothetical protein O7626_28910 [Micromonospora sp. WMMD1102]|nr:hypothetical protein [Micromonospora sp. WMMD1102]MDG4789900.1 hypothetical protein [Micromonospora sp. WMMD1102]
MPASAPFLDDRDPSDRDPSDRDQSDRDQSDRDQTAGICRDAAPRL